MSFFKPKSNEELDSETKRMEFEKENLRLQHEREDKYTTAKKELNKEKYAGVHNFVTGAKERLASMKKASEERNKAATPPKSKGFRGFNTYQPEQREHPFSTGSSPFSVQPKKKEKSMGLFGR